MNTPELDKMLAVKKDSMVVSEFLDFLRRKYEFCEWVNDPDYGERLLPAHVNCEKILAEFFNIDLEKVENEKLLMLKEMRENNERKAQH